MQFWMRRIGMTDSPHIWTRDEEYTAFVTGRWARLVRTGTLMGCGTHEAEDLAQAALVKCYIYWSKVRAADDQDAYVYRILVNTFRSARRRASRHETPLGPWFEGESPRDEFSQVDIAASVDRALSALSMDARKVVVLRYFADLSERQTAEVLQIPTGTVKSRLSRALAQLAADRNLIDVPGWSTS